jgi:hypothetical protein
MLSALFISTVCIATPLSIQERLPLELIPVRVVDSIDYARMFEGDVDREKNGMPLRFAQPTEVSISPATHGIWERLQNNKMRWTFRVFCNNALSMNLGFAKYNMPDSGSMTIMDETTEIQTNHSFKPSSD